MPFPIDMIISEGQNKLIQDEVCFDRASLQAKHNKLFSNLTDELNEVYGTITNDMSNGEGGVFFFHLRSWKNKKEYIWRTLSIVIRSKCEIV